jgi:hypothetical protein
LDCAARDLASPPGFFALRRTTGEVLQCAWRWSGGAFISDYRPNDSGILDPRPVSGNLAALSADIFDPHG